MIRDGATAEWTSLMHDVAKEIADDARDPDDGRDASGEQVRRDEWPDYRAGKAPLPWSKMPVEGTLRNGAWRDGLVEICGASKRAISDALTELGRAGYEVRKPITDQDGMPVVDKRGRVVFAAKGNALSFEVPYLPPRPAPQSTHQDATNGSSQSTHQDASYPPKVAESRNQSAQRSHPDVPKVAPECDPFPSSSPQEKSPHLSPPATVVLKVRAAVPSATEREIDIFIAQVEAEHSPDHVDRYIDRYAQATIAKKIGAIRANGSVPAADLRVVHAGSTPTPTPPKFQAPAPAAQASPESIEAFRAARLSLQARAPRSSGDPLRDIAAAQLEEARAGRATGQPESA
jgi:hypothetical protein